MRILGFTGTQHCMTEAQMEAVTPLVLNAREAHHGLCIGADDSFTASAGRWAFRSSATRR